MYLAHAVAALGDTRARQCGRRAGGIALARPPSPFLALRPCCCATPIIIIKESPMNTVEATAPAVATPQRPCRTEPLRSTRAHSSALSARLWLSPTDRRNLTK